MLRSFFLACCLFLVCGCVQLTDEQRTAVSEANTKIVTLGARVEKLAPTLQELCAKIKDVVEKIARGELPREEGEKLIALYKGKKSEVETEIKAAAEDMKVLAKTVEAINDAGVPWYQQLWLLLPGILGGIVAYQKNGKLQEVSAAFGCVSRAGDALPGRKFAAAVKAELEDSDVVDGAMMRPLYHAAKEKTI